MQTCRENLHVFVRNGNYSHSAENTLDGAFSGDCDYYVWFLSQTNTHFASEITQSL